MASSRKMAIVAHNNMQPVARIFPEQESCAIIGRVLRKWAVYKPAYGGSHQFSIEFVLVDKEGTKIEARIEKPYIYKHGHAINEGSVYNVSNFIVTLNHGEYRAAKHEYKLSLKFNAEIRPAEPVEVPVPAYSFIPPEECFQPDFNRNFLVDVAGVLLGIAQEREFSTPTGKSTRLIIEILIRFIDPHLSYFTTIEILNASNHDFKYERVAQLKKLTVAAFTKG